MKTLVKNIPRDTSILFLFFKYILPFILTIAIAIISLSGIITSDHNHDYLYSNDNSTALNSKLEKLTASQIKTLLNELTPSDLRDILESQLLKIEEQAATDPYSKALDELAENDHAFADIKNGHLAFNKPERMTYKSSSKLQLIISTDRASYPAKNYLSNQLKGKIQENDIKITRYISAELSASDTEFDIQPKGHQIKDMSGPQPSSWIWNVTPLTYGKEKQLTIDILGYLQSKEISSPPRSLQVFITSFDVDIDAWNWIFYQLGRIHSVWTVPAAILGGGWTLFIFLRQSKPQSKKSTASPKIEVRQRKKPNE